MQQADSDLALTDALVMISVVSYETGKPFIGFGGGEYKVDRVKVLQSTKDFNRMSVEERGCQSETQMAQCLSNNFREYANTTCKCRLLETLKYDTSLEVRYQFSQISL